MHGLTYLMLDYARRKTNHIWLYLACEEMMFGVRQLQRNNWVIELKENGAQRLYNSCRNCAHE